MSTLDAAFSSWSLRPWLAVALLIWATIYLCGWRILKRRDPARWRPAKAAAFIGGLATIYLALASPIEAFAPLLLMVHMVQHMLLMMVAPVLILVSEPFLPLLLGLPREIRRYWIAPLLRWPPLVSFAGWIVHPLSAWIIFVLTMWLWHLPGPYELALGSDSWHVVQHLCFLTAGIIFWFPVIRPFPSRTTWSQWLLIPYLLLADVQNTLLAAWLTFSDRVWYPHYSQMPRLGGLSALDDQAAAGVTMWVPGSVFFLVPLAWIAVRLLQGRKAEGGKRKSGVRSQESGVGFCIPALRTPCSAVRSTAPSPARPPIALALHSPHRSIRGAADCRVGHRRRVVRSAGWGDEFGRRGAVDSLAWLSNHWPVDCRQCFLLCLSVHAAAGCGTQPVWLPPAASIGRRGCETNGWQLA